MSLTFLGWRAGRGPLMVAGTAFLLVAVIGAATSYAPEDTSSGSQSHSGSDSEMLAQLDDYARSVATEDPASGAADGKLLPDVNTMIERLAARLETTPDDVAGWRMLGWSYFNMQRFEPAAAAYAKAVELDPSSTELKGLYEEAKTKASQGDQPQTPVSLQAGDEAASENIAHSSAMPADERDAAIRSMVDGLAQRLEASPRDVEGWTRLMRSRVVLGEKEVAADAFRKALEVFKGDFAASGRITAAAIELGLKVE